VARTHDRVPLLLNIKGLTTKVKLVQCRHPLAILLSLTSLLSCQGLQLLQFRSFVAVVVCLWNMLIYILEAAKNKGRGNWFTSASLVSSRG